MDGGHKSWIVLYRHNGWLRLLTLGTYPRLNLGMPGSKRGKLLLMFRRAHVAEVTQEERRSDTGLPPDARQIIGRVFDSVTCPAKAYQIEVEKTGCVIHLRPVRPAFCALKRLN